MTKTQRSWVATVRLTKALIPRPAQRPEHRPEWAGRVLDALREEIDDWPFPACVEANPDGWAEFVFAVSAERLASATVGAAQVTERALQRARVRPDFLRVQVVEAADRSER